MQPVEVPPDATVFISRGVSHFLYLGPIEMQTLQREWGLERKVGESSEEKAKRLIAFEQRSGGDDWDDRITILRVCLSRWCAAAGNGNGPVVLTDAQAAEILERADPPSGWKPKKFGPAYRVAGVWNRFQMDMLGTTPEEAESAGDPGVPKAPARKGSTRKPSSSRA